MGILSSKCYSKARLDGKTAIVTGCTAGIGKETVKDFYKRGAKVIMACRNIEAAKEVAAEIRLSSTDDATTGDLQVLHLDLSDLKSVKECSAELMKTEENINILVNNAGVMMCPLSRTVDGFEQQFGTNHLGHFLFTLLLLPKILESRPSRIIMVSSLAHYHGVIDFEDLNWTTRSYSAIGAYAQSKLANVLFAKELARRLEEKNYNNVTTYSLHPGVVATNLSRHFDNYFRGLRIIYDGATKIFAKNAEQGAQTTIYCAVEESCGSESGLYYDECRLKKPSPDSENPEIAKKLWDVSWELVGLQKNYDPFEVCRK